LSPRGRGEEMWSAFSSLPCGTIIESRCPTESNVMSQETSSRGSAHGVTWDLGDLYKSVDDPGINQDLDDALKRAQTFEAAYRGKIDVVGGPPAELLRDALNELEILYEQMDKPAVYASLLHAGKTDEPAYGALLSRTMELR